MDVRDFHILGEGGERCYQQITVVVPKGKDAVIVCAYDWIRCRGLREKTLKVFKKTM